MRRPLPAAARRLLDSGVLCHLAAITRRGPHLTPVVFVLDNGRLWATTARSSVKARSWRADPSAAGMVRVGDEAVLFRGSVRTYDALDPLSWPSAALAGPRLLSASARFSVKNARFFAGYAIDAAHVPLAWTPPGRVFVSVAMSAGAVVNVRTGETIDDWGGWEAMPARAPARRRLLPAPGKLPRTRGLDLRVPAQVRGSVGTAGLGAVAMQDADDGLVVLPASWRRVASIGAYEAEVPTSLSSLTGVSGRAPAALTVDQASAWRASEMRGMLLQGEGELGKARARRGSVEERDPDRTVVRLRPRRIVWWEGWSSGSVNGSPRGDR